MWKLSRRIVVSSLAFWALLPALLQADSEGGWAWAHGTTGSYSPFSEYSWNSSGGAITIRNIDIGRYDVRFEGLGIWNGGNGGNVQVNAYGGSGYCKTRGWFSDSFGVNVRVLCFCAAGTPANHQFTVAYTRYSGSVPDGTAYVWNDLVASSGTPSTLYQWDPAGFAIKVRYGTGHYWVKFPHINPEPSSVALVSPIWWPGLAGHRCRASWWGLSASEDGMTVEVRCYNSAGAPVDSVFRVAVVATNEVPIN